jgi:pyruvate dehydrogenase E1 component
MFERFDEIFRSCGWRVVELRYGKKLQAALDAHPKLKSWFDGAANADACQPSLSGRRRGARRIESRSGQSRAPFLQG